MALAQQRATKVSSLSAMWKKAIPTQAAFTPIPEGDYVAAIKEMIVELSKKRQRLQITTTYEIAMGDCEGKTVKRFDGLDNDTAMGYFKGYAEVIGFDMPEDISDDVNETIQILQEALDVYVAAEEHANDLWNINVSSSEGVDEKGNKRNYTNVYNNGLSDFSLGDGSGEAEAQQAADETPETLAQEEPQEVVAPLKRFARPTTNGKPVAKPIATKPVEVPQSTVKRVAVRR